MFSSNFVPKTHRFRDIRLVTTATLKAGLGVTEGRRDISRRKDPLDLLMTFAGCRLDEVSVDPAGVISDHALIICSLPIHVSQAVTAERLVRG